MCSWRIGIGDAVRASAMNEFPAASAAAGEDMAGGAVGSHAAVADLAQGREGGGGELSGSISGSGRKG